MQDIEGLALNTIVLIGERSQSMINWRKPFDASYDYTEGQYRALYLRIRRLMHQDDFVYDQVFPLDQDEDIVLVSQTIVGKQIIFAMILRTVQYQFTDILVGIVKNVASRSGIYTGEELHEQIYEALDRHQNQDYGDVVIDEFTMVEAMVYLETKNLVDKPKEFISILLNSLTSQKDITNYLHSKPVFESTMLMLSKIDEGEDSGVTLDSAYLMASNYKDATRFYNASKIFERIAEFANKYERMALEISCRIQLADIVRFQEDRDPSDILKILAFIDDGSLEVASPFDREVFYCLQGYAYDKLQDYVFAEDFYLMATMIAELEGGNSNYLAEAHAYIGELNLNRYDVETSIQSFLTASSIAKANGEINLSISYSHRAGCAELVWSKMLASTGQILHMDGNSGEYYGWKSMKHLMKAVRFTSPALRTECFDSFYPDIVDLNESVLTKNYDEYTEKTLVELKEHFVLFTNAGYEELQEKEIVNYLESRISAKLPVPDPVILLIANDGRLIAGGKIDIEGWKESPMSDNDDLFSGALSAIMALLSEVISSSNPLKMIDAGTTSIMIERSKNCIGALLVDRDVIVLRRALKEVLIQMEIKFPKLDDWDGYSLDFTPISGIINSGFEAAIKSLINV